MTSRFQKDRRSKKPTHITTAREQAAPPDRDFSRAEVRHRFICNGFRFWRVCAEKSCRRAKACVGDADACFERHWPWVHEGDKIFFRTVIKMRLAGLSHADACRSAAEEVARSADDIARVHAETLARFEAKAAARHGK